MNKKRNKKISEMYENGSTLEDVGKFFHVTRERVRQIALSEKTKEILNRLGLNDNPITKQENKMLILAAKEELRDIFLMRNKQKKNQKYEKAKNKIEKFGDYSNFSSLTEYSRATGIQINILKEFFPNIYNRLKNKFEHKWSIKYDRCRVCGTTTIKHVSYGLCEKCYIKSDHFKSIQESSRLRNGKKWKVQQRAYIKEYNKRPEVQKKFRQKNDIKFFNGNREIAIKRDNFRCVDCGMTRENNYKKFKKDLYVRHINNNSSDNCLANLKTLCFKCFQKENRNRFKLIKKELI